MNLKQYVGSHFFVVVFALLVGNNAVAVELVLSAADSAPVGSEVEVSWTGVSQKRDFITIVKPDAKENTYGKSYKYAGEGSPVLVIVPDDPGDYEIRYLDAASYDTLARRSIKASEVSASLSAPVEVKAGAEFEFSWIGPDNPGDFITLVEADTKQGKYKKYKTTKKGETLTLIAPDEGGDYELRYLMGQSYRTLASVPITVTSTSATLSAPAQVAAGAEFEFSWTGPDNPGDFISIVEAGAKERSYKAYQPTKKGETLTLKAPEIAGDYELRYLTGQKYKTLASTAIQVTATSANLTASAEVMAGAEFEVSWEGPNNRQDFITIVTEGAKDKSYKTYQYTKKGNPVTLSAPEVAGPYELRYLTGASYSTLASLPINITPASASLESPPEVELGQTIDVTWQGPGNYQDYLMILPAGAKENTRGPYAYVRRGKQLRINAPKEVGDYEVRYVTGGEHFTLASNPLKVLPSSIPGELQVIRNSGTTDSNASSDLPTIAIILDASGSMLKKLDGERRINIAKAALTDLANNFLPEGTPTALRVFGHREADACRTDLEIPLGPLNRAAFNKKVASVEAQNLAKTPIARSLELVASDLEGIEGEHLVILVTDGEETCEGDPRETIEQLRNSGYNIRINIVGFAIDELMLRETFQEWARLGGGRYFDAQNADELKNSMQEVTQVSYEVVDMEGNYVAGGIVGGPIIKVRPGTYNVKILSSVEQMIGDIQIEPEKLKTLNY